MWWLAGTVVLLLLGCGAATLRGSDGGAGQGGTGAGGQAGGAGTGGAAGAASGDGSVTPTWCTQQPLPPGVDAADSTCLDFDDGHLPSGGGWTVVTAVQGTSLLTMQRASSLPYSWQTSVSTGDGSKAALVWHDAGAQPIASVTVAIDVSPATVQGLAAPWTGSVSLMCVGLGSGRACVQYTVADDTSFATAYTGYYVTMEYDGGAPTFNEYQIYGTLQANIWTRIQMQITASSELVQVTIPGTTNVPVMGHFDADTAVDVTVGPETSGATSGWSGYLDNVVADVMRSK